jgi:hypothetical protein
MNRWAVRILGLFLILAFLLLFANLQRQLVQLQKTRGSDPQPTSTR